MPVRGIMQEPEDGESRVNTQDDEPGRWDFTATLLLILGICLVLVLTFELWGPHASVH
jgi:hypothetical protein